MNNLRMLMHRLDELQDKHDKANGKHTPIYLTASILSALIREQDEESQNFCQERGR